MDANAKALLVEAVNTLVSDPDAVRLYKQMLLVYEAAAKGIPVRLTGRPAVLNPMLELMLSDYETASNVLDLIDSKRDKAGLGELDEDGDFARRPYMSSLMARRRERLRRVVDAINLLRPANDAIRGAARVNYEQMVARRWNAAKTEKEAAARERLGRRLTKDERKRMTDQHWDEVEAEITDLEDFTQTELRKPLAARSPGFVFRVVPKKG